MKFEEMKDKIVLITGSGSGIGRAIAQGYASQGSKIVVADISLDKANETKELIEKNGGEAIAVTCDVSNEKSVINMVDQTLQHFNKIDILVNNAGIVCVKKLTIDVAEEEWDTIMDINLKGTFLCAKHVGRLFCERNEGVIINVGSITSKIPRWRMSSYSSSKAAVIQLTRALALEMAEFNVRVNAICPGGTNTPLLETSTQRDGKGSFEYRILGDTKTFRAGVPLRRLAEPEDHVGAAIFLSSNAASHITGQALFVDGGESII